MIRRQAFLFFMALAMTACANMGHKECCKDGQCKMHDGKDKKDACKDGSCGTKENEKKTDPK